MALFVRSNTQNHITEVRNIWIYKMAPPSQGWRLTNGIADVGRYDTEKEALEALDKIEQAIKDGLKFIQL